MEKNPEKEMRPDWWVQPGRGKGGSQHGQTEGVGHQESFNKRF